MRFSTIHAFAAITLCLVGLASCGSKGKNALTTLPLTTTTIEFADSITVGGSTAKCTAEVEYPQEGNAALLDSIRKWIDETIFPSLPDQEQSAQTKYSDLSNGQMIVDSACKAFLSTAKDDMQSYSEMDDAMALNYEYDVRIKNAFMTDSIVSYLSTIYIYTGGAHGATYEYASTFRNSDGLALGYNIFDTSAISELTAIVKEAISQQYFESDNSFTMEEALIIDPQDFTLPAMPPYFTSKGLTFVYQQYEIACYAAGMPTCTIPYSDIAPFILPDFRPLLPR